MSLLLSGLLIFFIVHLVPSFPTLRQKCIDAGGRGMYQGLFSLLSLVGLVLIVYGLKSTPFEVIYSPPEWGRGLNMLLMLPALYLFFSTSIGPAPSSAKVISAHPMNWGVVVWSAGHLLANGDKAHVILFASFLVFSLISIMTGNARGMKPALEKRPPLFAELGFVVVVVIVYLVLFWAHRYFTGMPLV
ncbi:MAG: NnrU family protein [Acidiferrobacterales bacterium]|nr:NnrU family protein [Acidiferrobacterales bacterium]